jgi:MOSC domain-containing protein YiiM
VPTYPVVLEHLLVSPGHRYFGRPADGPADVPTHDLDRVQVVAGKGLVGDRFFAKAAHMDAAVTLIAAEAIEAVADELDLRDDEGRRRVVDPLLTRRNIVIRGVPLDPLRGTDFDIVAADGSRVTLSGRRPAAPCAWMDRVIAPGAHAAMRGRGGLRCVPLTDGELVRGPATLVSPVELDPAAAGLPVRRRTRLP